MCGRVGLRVRGVPRLVRVLQGLAGLSTQAMPRPEVRTHPYARDRFSRASNQAVKRRIAASARSSISEIGLGFARTPPRHRPRIHQPPKLPPTLPPPLRGIPPPPTPLNAKSRFSPSSRPFRIRRWDEAADAVTSSPWPARMASLTWTRSIARCVCWHCPPALRGRGTWNDGWRERPLSGTRRSDILRPINEAVARGQEHRAQELGSAPPHARIAQARWRGDEGPGPCPLRRASTRASTSSIVSDLAGSADSSVRGAR